MTGHKKAHHKTGEKSAFITPLKLHLNKKGISPVIAIILLLMMTVAVAGAAFFWLSRIQNQLQGGVESFQGTIFTQISAAVDVVDADYINASGNENLTIFFQNTGNTKVPVSNSAVFPTTTWILRDSDQVARCSTNWNGTAPNVGCVIGCSPTTEIEVGQIHQVRLDLAGSACSLIGFGNGTVFSFTADFSGKTTSSGSFITG
jgi:flagellin-like protein